LSGAVRPIATLLGALTIAALGWWLWPSMPGAPAAVRDVEALIRSWGAWGVLGSIGLMVAHSFLPFPSEIIALANGMLYGPLWGTVITWVGAMLGAVAAFGTVRALGQPVLRRLLPAARHARLMRWSRAHGGLTLLVARLIPVIAFNLINYAAALTEITWWTFLWATGLGILPLTIVLAVLGDNVLDMPAWGWGLLLAAVAATWFLLHRLRPRGSKPSY
jgi:uncharacterized membrane protein YdjX (TVP38/TMEM64 family)